MAMLTTEMAAPGRPLALCPQANPGRAWPDVTSPALPGRREAVPNAPGQGLSGGKASAWRERLGC